MKTGEQCWQVLLTAEKPVSQIRSQDSYVCLHLLYTSLFSFLFLKPVPYNSKSAFPWLIMSELFMAMGTSILDLGCTPYHPMLELLWVTSASPLWQGCCYHITSVFCYTTYLLYNHKTVAISYRDNKIPNINLYIPSI